MDPNRVAACLGIIFLFTLFQLQLQSAYIFLCMYKLHNLNIQMFLMMYSLREQRRIRRFHPYRWRIPRPMESWFEISYRNQRIPQHHFRKHLRMDRNTFDVLLAVINPWILRQDTNLRMCIRPEKVLAIGLYRLAHGNSYVTIGAAFGVGKSTVIEAVQDVVGALYELRDNFIKFPSNEAETRACINTFREASDLPNIVGAIDGTHIKIKSPIASSKDYFSRYQQYDFIIQAVADGKKIFLDFSAGYPGTLHDARVMRNSLLYRRVENNEILQNPMARVGNHTIAPYLVGDSAYPLSRWLQKPFPDATRDPDEIAFNH